MKLITLLLVTAGVLAAQPKLTINAPSQVVAGTQVTAVVVLGGSAGNIVAVQDTLTFAPAAPAGLTITSALANKSNVCSGLTCVVIGVVPAPTIDALGVHTAPNATFSAAPIPDGSSVQTIVFTVPATMAPGSTITLTVGGTITVDASTAAIASSGSSVTMNVTTFSAMVDEAFTVWRGAPTQANLIALLKAVAAAF